MISKCKKNYKLVIAFILGILVSGIVVYATTSIGSNQVSYDNKTSGMSATTMQGALDELYEKSDIRKYGNFVSAYTYNQTEGSSNYCITGEESTCKKSTCYKTKTANSCRTGDIIKYKVNDTDIITFHVMYDKGETITMQSQKNTIRNTAWYADENDNTKGPLTILQILENVTAGWSNVNDRKYTMGATIFAENNYYTGCSYANGTSNPATCTANIYTLDERTARARMITVQEAGNLGCTYEYSSCPIWMYNYLYESINYGGTVNDDHTENGVAHNYGYWAMSAFSSDFVTVWTVTRYGIVSSDHYSTNLAYGARAVVEVSK